MERSIVVNENHQRSNSTPVSKSLGSLIKIDSISIDLSSAMDKNDPGKCDHFSIRGYVAEMRKKDWRICLPFALDDNNKSEKQTSVLPPLHVAKFRWWRCQNCLREIGDTSAAESHGDAVMVLSDVRQASKMDNFEGRTADFNTYANVNTDEHCFSSCRYKKEMKSENGNSTAAIGCENGSEDDGNRKLCNPTCDVTKFNPLLLEEKRTDGTVLKSQGNGLVEYCEPNCGSHEIAIIVPAIETLNCMGRSSAEICQKGELASAYDQQRNVLTACKTAEVVGKIDEAVDPVKDQRTRLPSLELEDCDIVSSESDEILAGNSPHDRHHVLTSRKARKVRLLTELLGAKRNAENNQIRTEGAPTNAMMPCASPGLHALSAHQNQVPVEGNLTKGFRGIKRKTKMPRDEDWKPVEMSRPNNVTKKVRVFKGDAETTNTSIEIADSASEEDASAVVLKTDRKGHWTNHRINRNPTRGRKKNKETKVGDGYSPLVPWRGVVSGKNQIEIGDADKCGAAADMPKSAHGAFTGRGQQLYLESYLSPEQTERNLSFCKMKNKMPQVEDGQKYLSLKRNSMLGEGSIRRKDVEIMQTRPEGVKFQWVHYASAKNGLDLSLNSYMAIQRKDINYFTRIDGGVDPLMPQQKGITREEHWRGKDVMHVGETSCPHKSGPDTSFDRGLLCDLNETITHRTSFLREMQNCDPLVNDGSFSLRQKMDFSDSRNNKETIEVQEHSEVIKKHSNQKADKLFEQGPSEDIPMDIVELMAKNQYDRLHESERDYCLSERTIDKRNAEIMVFPKVHGSRVLGSLLEENPHKRKPPLSGNARNGVITAGDNVGPTKQNPANCFSQINRNHFNLGELEGNPACMGFNTFSQRQEKLSGGVQFSASSPIRNSCTMNCKWKGENVVHRSSQTNMPVLELCNTCRYGSQQNEEAEHVRSSMIPNHSLFGLKIPQKCATQSSNVEMISECPVTLQKRKMIEDLDMNFLNLSATKLEMQNRNFDSESIKRMSAKQPFICKHGGIELKTDGMGSLDLYPNETIPAMQLLSLMDAGVQSSTPFSLDGKPMFFGKPFFPCEHHPNVGLDTKSKFLEKPSLPCDHHSKEFSVIGTGVYKASDSSRYPSSAFCGKNRPSEKSCECSPAVGAFTSLFQNDGYFKRASGFTGRVSSKFQEEDTAKISYSAIKNRGRRSQKSVCIRGVAAGKSSTSNPVQDKKNGFLGAPDSAVSPLQCHRIEDSTKQRGLEAHSVNEIVWSMKNTSKTDICSVNRNPADFSIPEAGNVYMISGEDLKFGKKITSKDRSGLIRVDGRKRQRLTKLAAMNEHAQHHVS